MQGLAATWSEPRAERDKGQQLPDGWAHPVVKGPKDPEGRDGQEVTRSPQATSRRAPLRPVPTLGKAGQARVGCSGPSHTHTTNRDQAPASLLSPNH